MMPDADTESDERQEGRNGECKAFGHSKLRQRQRDQGEQHNRPDK